MRVAQLLRSAGSACVMLALAVGLGLGAVNEGRAGDVGQYGGSGGGNFRSKCRGSDALIGINMRSGSALDAVVAICIPLTADRKEWGGGAYEPTQYWGGGGGGYQKIACQPGDVVSQLRVSKGPWGDGTVVKHIRIECQDLGSDYVYEVAPGQIAGETNGTRWLTCPSNALGSGIYGRSGALVDKIGLACD